MADYDPNSTEGLAAHSSERLQMNARGLFTSDLSVNEYLCVEKAGFEPVGLVVGSSIYHVGYQFAEPAAEPGARRAQPGDVSTRASWR